MTLGGAWVSPLTGGFKSPGPAWNILKDTDHVPRSLFFPNILGPIQNGRRGPRELHVCIFQEYEEPVYSYNTYPGRR